MTRGPGLDVGRETAQHVVGASERPLIALRDRPPGAAFSLGGAQDLVVDVGDVAAERDLIAAHLEPADKNVEADTRADMPDVRWCLHRRAAQVEAGLARDKGHELAHGAGRGVVEAERHLSKATGLRARHRLPPRVSRTAL